MDQPHSICVALISKIRVEASPVKEKSNLALPEHPRSISTSPSVEDDTAKEVSSQYELKVKSSEGGSHCGRNALRKTALPLEHAHLDMEFAVHLRLDFNSFVISGPVTLSSSTGKATNGIVAGAGAKEVNLATQCLTDRFSVTNPGSSSPPTICGTNTGTHMYVDANENCNELAFQLGASSSVSRQWSIKITQYACDFDNLAPQGCTQYHFGSNSGTIKNYNFDGGAHLANQEQKICVRQERGNCQTCYFQIEKTDFSVSGEAGMTTGFTSKTQCCGYGSNGEDTKGYDCLVIPGALKQTDKQDPAPGSQFCGGLLTTINEGTDGKTVCTKQRPFHVTFRSDHFEHPDESETMITAGFRLAYTQKSC
eukprot:TCALIF_11770-PA protein Name:"Protein of unknown function" AED:0.15 eAED:0.15 QI:0/0.55/0.7/0.7/0.22/0.4/10/4/366